MSDKTWFSGWVDEVEGKAEAIMHWEEAGTIAAEALVAWAEHLEGE